MSTGDRPHVALRSIDVVVDAFPGCHVVGADPHLSAGVRRCTADQVGGLEDGDRPAAERSPERRGEA